MGRKSRLSHNRYYYKKKSSQDLTVSVPLQKLTNPIGKYTNGINKIYYIYLFALSFTAWKYKNAF